MESVSLVASFFKMIVALVLVLGVLIAVAYILRRVMGQAAVSADGGSPINIISTKYLGPKSSIILVDVLGHIMVVGLSTQQITVLATITDGEAVQKIKRRQFQRQDLTAVGEQLQRYKHSLQSLIRPERNKGAS